MDIAIIYKWAYDPDDALVREDGTVKWRRGRLVASDDEAAAIACARNVVQATNGQLVGVTFGNGDAGWALARGAARAVSAGEYGVDLDEARIAGELASVVKAAGDFDLIVMGSAQSYAAVPAAIAGKLGLPLVADVMDFSIDEDNPGKVFAHRMTGHGIETLSIGAPAVIAVAAIESETDVPTMKQMLAAHKLPVDEPSSLEELPQGKVELVASMVPKARKALILDGGAAQAADALAEALHGKGVL